MVNAVAGGRSDTKTAATTAETAARKRSVLIIVENLPVPFDRRVWQEANALREAGYRRFRHLPERQRI